MLVAAPAAQAHQIWFEQDGKAVKLQFGEFALNQRETTPGLLDKFGAPSAMLLGAKGERTLKLDNARVAESRAEALDEPQTYDALTARALDVLAGIIEVGGHLLKPGGTLLAMKGVRPDEEIAALPAGWSVATVEPLTVPGLVGERHMVVVRRD